VLWLLERNSRDGDMWSIALHKIYAQVVALCTYKACITMVARTVAHKDWRGVARTKWLEVVELTIKVVGDISKA
jgi:hypothetical protein